MNKPTFKELQAIAQDAGGIITVKSGWLWVKFPGKLTPKTRQQIKAAGFTWNNTLHMWGVEIPVITPPPTSSEPAEQLTMFSTAETVQFGAKTRKFEIPTKALDQ